MSGWSPRLVVAIVVVVLLLSVLFASRLRQAEPDEPAPRGARAQAKAEHVQAKADQHASSKPLWKGAEPILDRDSNPEDAEVGQPRGDLADAARAEPEMPLAGAKAGAASRSAQGRATGAGAADDKEGDGASVAPEVAKANPLAEAATASGIAPRFAAFGQASGGAAIGATPSEQENVDFDSAPGAYFPPNALLGFPGRGGLQLEAGTVMFWVQPVDWDGSTDLSYSFFLLRDTSSLDHHFAILKNQGSLRFQIINADGVEFDVLSPIGDWQRGEWHHVAATWGDSLMDLWVDGALVGEQSVDGIPSVQPNSPAYWGSSRGTAGAGAILADGRIFDSVLSPADIVAEAQRVPR